MPTNNNVNISLKLKDSFKIQEGIENVPTKVAESIVPVLEVSAEKKIQVREQIMSDASSQTIITTSSTKRTFFIGGLLSVSKDVVSDAITSSINITPHGGQSRVFLGIRYEPLTAGQFSQKIILPFPIELKKNTPIGLINSSATASIDALAVIYYYEED